MTLETVRTPDERFSSLPDWPYEPHYVDDLPGRLPSVGHFVQEQDGEQVARAALTSWESE